MESLPILGVLGGMGPLATVEFLRKVIAHTPANIDQEHIPCITYSMTQTPCRVNAILHDGPSPLKALLDGVATLETAGAQAIAMPCVTAHHWLAHLENAARVPFLDITEATIKVLATATDKGSRVGLLATQATLEAGHFQQALTKAGYVCVTPDSTTQNEWVLPAILKVKVGERETALELALKAVAQLRRQGTEHIVLACTELPVALHEADADIKNNCVDTLDALARACVAWAGIHAQYQT